MKSIAGKIKKQRAMDVRASRPCCGTLNHIAECRGTRKKTGSVKWPGSPDGINTFARKYTAARF